LKAQRGSGNQRESGECPDAELNETLEVAEDGLAEDPHHQLVKHVKLTRQKQSSKARTMNYRLSTMGHHSKKTDP
jgi:hypothetical protein